MIASSSSSPPTRIDCETTIPPSEITATSLVPPPMSTTIEPGRLADRQAGADRGRHRLLDQVGLARAGRQAGLLDRALLHAGHARGHADHDARVRPAVLVDLLDEVAQHLLGHVEVGDHAVLQRPDGLDRARACGRASAWPRCRRRGPRRCASRSRRRDGSREHDAAAAHVDERVGGAQVDRHVAATEAGEVAEEAHARVRGPSDDRRHRTHASSSLPTVALRSPQQERLQIRRRAAQALPTGRPTTLR